MCVNRFLTVRGCLVLTLLWVYGGVSDSVIPVDPRVRLAIVQWPVDAPRGAVTTFCAEHGLSQNCQACPETFRAPCMVKSQNCQAQVADRGKQREEATEHVDRQRN